MEQEYKKGWHSGIVPNDTYRGVPLEDDELGDIPLDETWSVSPKRNG